MVNIVCIKKYTDRVKKIGCGQSSQSMELRASQTRVSITSVITVSFATHISSPKTSSAKSSEGGQMSSTFVAVDRPKYRQPHSQMNRTMKKNMMCIR